MWGRRVSPGCPVGRHLVALDKEQRQTAICLPLSQWQSRAVCVEGDAVASPGRAASPAPHLYWISMSLSALGHMCSATS